MAGDWIKMRVDLGDDPAVVLIAARLDIEEDEVVGKLHRLWCWADKHTTDGTAPAITARWVDRYVNKSGFASAMEEAGWIQFDETGVIFPSFDRHNGESAKRRVEATLRQRLSRANRDNGVTGESRAAIPKPFSRFVMQRDGYQCVFCGTKSDEKTEASKKARLSIDHLNPVSRGGSTAVENLVCSCRDCNNEKNDRTPDEWGLLPTFLQPGVLYEKGMMVTASSQKKCDDAVTREEKSRETTSHTPSASAQIAMVLRKHSINATPFHPSVVALADQEINLDTLEACCAEARKAKPNESLSVAYIVKKLEGWKAQAASVDVRGAQQRPKAVTSWTLTPQAMSAKARELGISDARPGETEAQFKARIIEAINASEAA